MFDWDGHQCNWAKLCMIHGSAEVRNRIQTRLDNYAIYSALFLGISMMLLASPPEKMMDYGETLDVGSPEWWWWSLSKRVCLGGFALGTGAHLICILLSIRFTDAMSET